MKQLGLEQNVLGRAWTSTTLWESLRYLCDECNGRFAGTADERRAGDYMLAQFREMGLQNVHAESFQMRGWVRGDARLALLSEQKERALPCMALAGSPANKVTAEVIDIGPGTPQDFARLGDAVAGKIVLASAKGPHRLEKYTHAYQAGAAGFLFANTRPGMMIPAGSLGMGTDPARLPGAGLALETADFLRRQLAQGTVRVRLAVEGQIADMTARNIVAELPGTDPEAGWIVACAHYDGHDIAQGAQDNATGTAIVLETARLLAPLHTHLKAGVRFVLFSGEELGMFGSAAYVRDHAAALDQIRTVFNADVVGLAAPLVLSAQNCRQLDAYLRQLDLGACVHEPSLVPYSDHFPFVMAGVPALMAWTSSPSSGSGWAHTAADTLDKLELRPLRDALATTARILLRMASQPEALSIAHQSPDQVEKALREAGLEEKLRLQGRWPF